MPISPGTGRCMTYLWIHHSKPFATANASGMTRYSYQAGAVSWRAQYQIAAAPISAIRATCTQPEYARAIRARNSARNAC